MRDIILTSRQRQVLELVADGWTNKQIEQQTGLTRGALDKTIARLGILLGVDQSRNLRVQIAVRWTEQRAFHVAQV